LQEVLAGAACSRLGGAAGVGSLESIDRALEAGHPAFAASCRGRESFRVSRDVKEKGEKSRSASVLLARRSIGFEQEEGLTPVGPPLGENHGQW
jgi:hypothetical protein